MSVGNASSNPVYTIVYDGVTYSNVGVLVVTPENLPSLYSVIQVQPWFTGQSEVLGCSDFGPCDQLTVAAKFTVIPYEAGRNIGAAVVTAPDPIELSSVLYMIRGNINQDQSIYAGGEELNLQGYDYSPAEDAFASLASDIGGIYYLLSNPSPSAADTLASFQPNVIALRNAFNLQAANTTQGLNNDCTLFDGKNICVSFTGTRSTQNGSDLDATTGTVVIAHRPIANVHFGGYINQNFGASNQGGLRLERRSPSIGAFVNYTLTSGLNVRGSVAYGKMDMQTTREAIDTAEAGVGKSNIKTQGLQLELNKAFDIKLGWVAIPYGGLRKVTNKRAGYTETASDTVTAPLTYAELQQSQTTAFGGVRFLGNIAPQTQLLLSAGVEHDLSSKTDDYAATGVDGLGSVSMQADVKKNRSVFSAALSYDIAKNERASISVLQRQEVFDSKAVTSVGFSYMKGF